MTTLDFWSHILSIIEEGFTSKGLEELEEYADKFSCKQLLYQRFSPSEQHGCAAGGYTNVIATILAGAENSSNHVAEGCDDFKRQQQCGEAQTITIEKWSKASGCWIDNVEDTLTAIMGEQIAEGGEAHVYDHGSTLVKSIGLDYYIEPILALDRIALHNTYFPETKMSVLGFGRDKEGQFRIIVEQSFVEGCRMTDSEIKEFAELLGFKLINPRNWTYATPFIYLSDMHDENVIRTPSGSVAVIDCDIRINTANLRCGGTRRLSPDIIML